MGREVRRLLAAVIGIAALFVAMMAVPSSASSAPGDTWPLTPQTDPVTINPAGLYGSSGNQIFEFVGADGQKTTQVTAQTAAGAPDYWASNLGLGPDSTGGLQFVGSRYNTAYPQLYGLKNGDSGITEIGSAAQAQQAWGGLSVSPDGTVWQGTNLQTAQNTRLSRFDPRTGATVISGPVTSTQSDDQVWANGLAAPDYAFDQDGNLFGLIFGNGEGKIYRYNVDSFSAESMTATPVLSISGPALAAGTANYGFAWHAGAWYSGNADGTLYRIDPKTGESAVAGRVTTPATYDYRLTDLASAEVMPVPPVPPVAEPRVEITKTADRSTANPGETVRFEVTARNTGSTALPANFTDELDQVLDESNYLGDAVTNTGSLEFTGSALIWRGDLNPGQSATVSFGVQVKAPPLTKYQLINRVSSTLGNVLLPQPVTVDLSGFQLTKNVDRTTASPGQVVTYTVTGKNVGRTDLRADFTDDLSGVIGGAAFRGDIDATSGRALSDSSSIRWQGLLPIGQTVTVQYSVRLIATGSSDTLRNAVSSTTAGNTEVPEVVTAVTKEPGDPSSDSGGDSTDAPQDPSPDARDHGDPLAVTGSGAGMMLPLAITSLILGAGFLLSRGAGRKLQALRVDRVHKR